MASGRAGSIPAFGTKNEISPRFVGGFFFAPMLPTYDNQVTFAAHTAMYAVFDKRLIVCTGILRTSIRTEGNMPMVVNFRLALLNITIRGQK